MAKHLGKSMTAQIWDSSADGGAGAWRHICGLTTKSWSRATETVDVTTDDCDDPANTPTNKQTMVVMKEYSFDGEGIFKSKENFALINSHYENALPIKFKLTQPEVGSWECPDGWAILSLEADASSKEVITFKIQFEPTGRVEFKAD